MRKSKTFLYNLIMNNKIKDYRKLKNITQEEMASKLNVSRQSYINYESGETEPSFETLKQISSILNVSIDDLLDNKPFSSQVNIYTEALIDEIENVINKYKKNS